MASKLDRVWIVRGNRVEMLVGVKREGSWLVTQRGNCCIGMRGHYFRTPEAAFCKLARTLRQRLKELQQETASARATLRKAEAGTLVVRRRR